ncbi:hypothetical protein [Lentilitoribacter sp. EG35]|uniref:hypothetical protein n=1 Tax=Lentilitoribacter sp. EG35 TaxID=3234192 RepID=UPI00345FD2F1
MTMRANLKKQIFNYEDGKGFAYEFRKRRSKFFMQFIDNNFDGAREITIVDFGGTEVFWKSIGFDYLREKNMKITLVNLEAISIVDDDIFTSVVGDARNYSPEQMYDICFSNSCIEHVGQMADFIDFRNSAQSIAKTYFIQTPSFHFPIEPHFVSIAWHWLPKALRVLIVNNMSVGHFDKGKDLLDSYVIVESCYLLSHKIFKKLFYDGKIHKEKFGFFTKSFIAVKGLEQI